MRPSLETAERFARALDAENYTAAAALLSPGCEYTCRGTRYHGPAEIIETYRRSGESVQHDFDAATYESRCERLTQREALIHFVDRLTKSGQTFTFACQQLVEVDNSGQIVRIEHQDLPGQREALTEFKRKVGPNA